MEQMRLDENPPIVPVARATEVLTRLYLWLLIQLCSCNHFLKILNDTMKNWQYEKLKISPFDEGKKKIAVPASKALITSYFLNIKGFLRSPFYFLCCSYMSGQSSYYAHVLSFFLLFFFIFLLWTPDLAGHLIWRLRGFRWPSIFLDFVTVGHFCCHILSCPSPLWNHVVYFLW